MRPNYQVSVICTGANRTSNSSQFFPLLNEMATMNRTALRLSTLASATALLVACGGGGDASDAPVTPVTPEAREMKVGDQYTVAVQVGDQAPSSQSFRVYGISEQLKLVSSDSGNLVAGSLFALPEDMGSAKSQTDDPSYKLSVGAFEEALESLLLAQSQSQSTGVLKSAKTSSADTSSVAPAAVVRELADLDSDLPTVVADLLRSGLTPLEYVQFYDALDGAPGFVDKEDAEGQLLGFFQTVQDEVEQGTSCGNIAHRINWCSKAATTAVAGITKPSTGYVPNQKDFLAALASQGLSWQDFLARMNARGQDYADLLLAFNEWAVRTAPAFDANLFPAFIAAYLAGDAGTAAAVQSSAASKAAVAVQAQNSTDMNAVMQGLGSIVAPVWDFLKNASGLPGGYNLKNFVLSSKDIEPAHYANATSGKSEQVVVSVFDGDRVWTKAQFRLEGQYNATHQTLGGRWIPKLSFEVISEPAARNIGLTARANMVSVVNAGSQGEPIPQAVVRVDITQGSAFNTKINNVWFLAHGTEGFSLIDKD